MHKLRKNQSETWYLVLKGRNVYKKYINGGKGLRPAFLTNYITIF